MGLIALLLFGGFFLLLVLSIVFGEPVPPREEVFGAFAERIGWPLQTDKDLGFGDRFPEFHEFHRGDDRYAYNQMEGSWPLGDGLPDLECLAGDYHYETEEEEEDPLDKDKKRTVTRDHEFSFLLIRLPYPTEGDLQVRPETFFDRIGSALGFDDIDFESDEFSRAFAVTSSDKRFAYDVLHPRAMDYLLATKPSSFLIGGGWLRFGAGGRWQPEEFEEKLKWAAGLLALWPRHLQTPPTEQRGRTFSRDPQLDD